MALRTWDDQRLMLLHRVRAGKYVPSITHYILEADAQARGYLDRLSHARGIGKDVEGPVFPLGGMAIGNG